MVESNVSRRNEPGESQEDPGTDRSRPSSAGCRQRESTASTGAFGQRIGRSDLVFLEGILPAADGRVGDEPIERQTERCLDRLEEVLAGYGLGLEDLVRVRVAMTDLDAESRRQVDDAYAERFDCEFPPRTVEGVCELPGDARIQLEAIAADE
ncbi:enamine deaminase RidA [Halobiforma lacisalsi AJ5]|uniref:Enamine deaminase RidA n=1 Tax=Natronobacterium lacisalsi AJ5 TaxID=358396 RepID=M0LKW0_NATLA|nr:RidA family protein [Halobiforma lacisalsi]APW98527.1 enamine deaminase RidA [Halobiforma lacisalsi AJ5]EMA33054.1 endoribonuclease L-PSP [Halobiforma lacisalsi AJ5]